MENSMKRIDLFESFPNFIGQTFNKVSWAKPHLILTLHFHYSTCLPLISSISKLSTRGEFAKANCNICQVDDSLMGGCLLILFSPQYFKLRPKGTNWAIFKKLSISEEIIWNAKVSVFFIVSRRVCGPFIKFVKFCTGRRPEHQNIPKYLHMRFGFYTVGPSNFH